MSALKEPHVWGCTKYEQPKFYVTNLDRAARLYTCVRCLIYVTSIVLLIPEPPSILFATSMDASAGMYIKFGRRILGIYKC